jgi:hypothetical protein
MTHLRNWQLLVLVGIVFLSIGILEMSVVGINMFAGFFQIDKVSEQQLLGGSLVIDVIGLFCIGLAYLDWTSEQAKN